MVLFTGQRSGVDHRAGKVEGAVGAVANRVPASPRQVVSPFHLVQERLVVLVLQVVDFDWPQLLCKGNHVRVKLGLMTMVVLWVWRY